MVINNIKSLRQGRGLSMQKLADLCDPPATASQINKLEKGFTQLTPKWMGRISKALRCDPRDLISPPGHSDQPQDRLRRSPDASEPMDTARDLPVRSALAGTSAGAIFIDMGKVIDLARRPPGLAGARDAYAFYMVGDAMWPRFGDGDLIYVHPHLPVHQGDDVVVHLRGGKASPAEIMVSRLILRDAERLVVRQFDSAATREVPMADISAVHKIMTLQDLLK